jgi:hypothetical protein
VPCHLNHYLPRRSRREVALEVLRRGQERCEIESGEGDLDFALDLLAAPLYYR